MRVRDWPGRAHRETLPAALRVSDAMTGAFRCFLPLLLRGRGVWIPPLHLILFPAPSHHPDISPGRTAGWCYRVSVLSFFSSPLFSSRVVSSHPRIFFLFLVSSQSSSSSSSSCLYFFFHGH